MERSGIESRENTQKKEVNNDVMRRGGLQQVAVRLIREANLYSRESVNSAEDAVRIMAEAFQDYDREALCVINLNAHLQPINFNIASVGALNQAIAHPRELLKTSFLSNAASIIMLHTHPSGNLEPSHEDIQITDRMNQLCELAGIPLLDHIIIGAQNTGQYYSMQQRGIMPISQMSYVTNTDELKWNLSNSKVAEERSNYKERAEEKREETNALISKMLDDFQTDPEVMLECLKFGERFNNYSLRNMMLIYAQNPNAIYTQSFQAWKEEGVSVKKGEHGMMILVPVLATYLETEKGLVPLKYATKDQKEAYRNGSIEGKTVRRFRVGTTFDIAQTTFPPEKYPELFSMGYGSEKHAAIAEALVKYSEKELHVPVQDKDLSSITLRGYYEPGIRSITLNALMKDTQRLSTLTHELGHAIAMHGENTLTAAGGEKSEAQVEYEADCISAMLETHFGIEINDTRMRHFKTHYETWQQELNTKYAGLSVEEQKEKINEATEEAFGFIFDKYKEEVAKMNPYVESRLKKMEVKVDAENAKGVVAEKMIESQPEVDMKSGVEARAKTEAKDAKGAHAQNGDEAKVVSVIEANNRNSPIERKGNNSEKGIKIADRAR